MKRIAVALFAILMAAAAPTRAWCEASCLAAAHTESATPHCPAHEPSSDRTKISAIDTSDCPTIEAARPVPATLVMLQPAVAVAALPSSTSSAPARNHSRTNAARPPLTVPLRV